MRTEVKMNKKSNVSVKKLLILIAFFSFTIANQTTVYAQDLRWLHVSELQAPINEVGAEYEGEFTSLLNTNYFSWPAQYGLEQNTMRMQGLWIGCKNFDDPVEGKVKSVKVIGSGPRQSSDRVNEIFEKSIQLVAKRKHPLVFVDDAVATLNGTYDVPDSIDENMDADREVIVKFNTSIGVSVVKKVKVFASQNHGNYYIYDYEFTNTGIYNRNGDVKKQTLTDLYFYWIYRMAYAGESVDGYASTWGAFASSWGNSTVNHTFGEDPNAAEFNDASSPLYQLRGFYSWYGSNKDRAVKYEEDWGCPNESEDGRMGSWQYSGCVTLHADKTATDKTNDNAQPKTTWFIGSDINAMMGTVSQYDEIFMSDRYTIMSEGHPDKPHDQYVGEDYAINYTDARRQAGGGTSQGHGYGPYTLMHGETVHIVFAFGIAGLSREKNHEVGKNWIQWYKNSAQPQLIMPDGSTTTNFNLYKRKWVETGKDSILKTFYSAVKNFKAGYKLPQPPPPPEQFYVYSGGDRIALSWSDNAANDPHFNGYVVYRSLGNVTNPQTKYEKIFECEKSNAVHAFDDVTAVRGFDYYYYVQTKDDGTQNVIDSGQPLFSNMVWTVTSQPATLQRPAVSTTLDSVRVVPNPYDIRNRIYQFGDKSTIDRIAFYGLPPVCKLKIFTERGDLIWEKDHTRGTGDELWDSTTKYGQIVVSGVYILYVEAPDGRKIIRKFVIIR